MLNPLSSALSSVPDPDDFKQGAGDEKLLVIFFRDILKDDDKSISEGRPIYYDTDWLRIHIPGDPTNVIVRPASEQDKRRFPVQWGRYQQGMKDEEQIQGTPLKEWPMVSRAQVEELRYFKLFTVEHLADVSDTVKLRVPGLTKLAQQARIWLEKASHTAVAAQHQQTIDTQANRIEVLERTVRTLVDEKERLAEKAGVTA